MRFFKCFLSFFTTITTAMLALMAVIHYVTSVQTLPKNILLQIIVAGAAAAFTTSLFAMIEEKPGLLRNISIMLLQYAAICGEMIGFGLWFGWIEKSTAFLMPIYVAIVYVAVTVVTFILYFKEADEINRALSRRNENKTSD